MFTCDYKKLTLSFNEFHNIEGRDMPDYGEFCLLELKDGRYTAGEWLPDNYGKNDPVSGKFCRGTADTVSLDEIAKWHSLNRYDLSACLEDEEIGYINLGHCDEDTYSVRFKNFKSLKDKKYPKSEQYCLLIMMDGGLASGRWDKIPGKGGLFIYASALASYSMDKVWAWTALSDDDVFVSEQESEKERRQERKLNQNPSIDPVRFKYGTDIAVYYEKALKKLLKKYPKATLAQMKKVTPWEIVPYHGQYVFGRVNRFFPGSPTVEEWTEGSTADEFIDFLCKYVEEPVKNYDPDKMFKFGMDIKVYLDRAYENVKKEYRWLNKKILADAPSYAIRQVNGDWEFVKRYKGNRKYYVCNDRSAESFIESVECDYRNAALMANPVVAVYAVPFGRVEINGWYLERYEFSKLKTGDYRVDVQAGDRVTGGNRTFFITPHCFEAKTYEEFLDRYLKIVPPSFGMDKEDLLPNEDLKAFLGY